jgi:TRAP-type mannitol/chloroaromatic compound transport system substrate-binding protein
MKTKLLSAVAGIALMGGAASAQVTIEMTAAFGKNLPILGTAGVEFVDRVNLISNEVEFVHYDPGKLVPTFEALDAVANGSVDAAFAATGYWQGKLPAASIFSAVPFGPEAGEFMGWILYGNGAKYWQQMYDDADYNVKTLPCGVIAPETSGWFKKEINKVEDLEGLNMRFFGLGAKAMEKLGVSTSLLAGGDIFPALERGAIDATEFSMPRIDARLGFYKIAKYNYFPGWHQPATLFELLINGDVWEDLSETAQAQIETTCLATFATTLAEGEATNYQAMITNIEENGVIQKQWSPEMLDAFEGAWNEVVTELEAEDPFFKEVWADLTEYRKGYKVWSQAAYMDRNR